MTSQRRSFASLLAASVLAMAISASSVYAQSQGRVVRDGTVIWRSDAAVVARTAPAGMILEITAQSDRWYEVVIPAPRGGRGERGLIAIGSVELVPGTPQPPVRALRGSPPPPGPGSQPGSQRPAPVGRQTPLRPAFVEPAVGVRGFGQAAFAQLNATKSFEAVLGDARGPLFGGGAQVRLRNGVFAQASWERFRQTGERVFVFEETVFPLGIPNTITITPIRISAGYRFHGARRAVPYLGGGFGSYRLQEEAAFAEPGDDVDERFSGYQVLGGVELRVSRWLASAFEVEYASVPDALGVGGVSEVFDEHDLGSIQVRVKVLIGR
jgi:hypothetical protein